LEFFSGNNRVELVYKPGQLRVNLLNCWLLQDGVAVRAVHGSENNLLLLLKHVNAAFVLELSQLLSKSGPLELFI